MLLGSSDMECEWVGNMLCTVWYVQNVVRKPQGKVTWYTEEYDRLTD